MAETSTTPAGNQYEAMFLFGQSAASDLEHAIQTVRQMIERHGGSVMVLKKWDERKLAYEINGNKRGTYVIAYFKAPGSVVTQIERDVNLSEEVLRVMVTRADHLNQHEMELVEPQPIIREERPSWERDDRGGGGGYRRDDRGPRRDDRAPRREEGAEAAPAPASAAMADKE
ncbi:MAG TPA: 30S ribosomal protein S6 [Humisphaera sp.]|jgi:small subunit ribosomal protein S6|nr:30S ribosomal protein S6 [Humisphaera sp.]